MQRGGRIAAQVKKELIKATQPGVTTLELDKLAEKLIKKAGALPSFKGYKDYPCSIVTCLNKETVHGIPGPRQLKKGDLLTIDLGIYYQGFHTDTAISMFVGMSKPDSFLNVGQKALQRAISKAQPANHIGDISHAIQQTIETAGYNVIRTFVGHGIGRLLHEPPQIPCFGKKGTAEEIKIGMTLAIEVMYAKGSAELEILDDNWTAVTKDKSLTAMFEETVAVTSKQTLVLTAR